MDDVDGKTQRKFYLWWGMRAATAVAGKLPVLLSLHPVLAAGLLPLTSEPRSAGTRQNA